MMESITGKRKQPNIVFIFPDEFRQQSMGFMGQDPVVTPNLDRFASESLVLVNAVSNMPICSPYRAMLFTGMYPYSTGVMENVCSKHTKHGIYLKEDTICLSDVLKENNYHCGYVGKWHLDPPAEPYEVLEPGRSGGVIWDAYTPPGKRRHGFDFWYSYGCCDQHLTPHYWTGDGNEYEGRRESREWSPRHETEVVLDYIKNTDGKYRDENKPFAVFWAPNPPHMPFDQVPKEYLAFYDGKSPGNLLNRENVDFDTETVNVLEAKKQVANYFAAITGIDEQFGKVLQCLEEEGIKEDTIVIFTSDHGEMMGSHDLMGKSVWYDEAFLVPFIIRWPKKINLGISRLHLGVPDIMPTLLAMAGLEDEIPGTVEGTNYMKALIADQAEMPDSSFGIRWKAPHKDAGEDIHDGFRAIRTDRYTYVVERENHKKNVYLYDNLRDKYQIRNLYKERNDIVEKLDIRLKQWMKKTNDPWLNLHYN